MLFLVAVRVVCGPGSCIFTKLAESCRKAGFSSEIGWVGASEILGAFLHRHCRLIDWFNYFFIISYPSVWWTDWLIDWITLRIVFCLINQSKVQNIWHVGKLEPWIRTLWNKPDFLTISIVSSQDTASAIWKLSTVAKVRVACAELLSEVRPHS